MPPGHGEACCCARAPFLRCRRGSCLKDQTVHTGRVATEGNFLAAVVLVEAHARARAGAVTASLTSASAVPLHLGQVLDVLGIDRIIARARHEPRIEDLT